MQNNFEKKTEAFLNQDQLVLVNIMIKKIKSCLQAPGNYYHKKGKYVF